MYERYIQTFPYYTTISSRLIALADIQPGMIAVDLACGTGIVTRQVVPIVGHYGLVIGVDSSEAVLDVAQQVIHASNVRFLHARAETIHEVLEKETIDIVLCNSAFWKCEPLATLHAVSTILKPEGRFVLNLVENYTRKQAQWQLPTAFQQLLLEVARERGIPAPERKIPRLFIGEQSIENLIRMTSLIVVSKEQLEMHRTPEEVVEFFKIPAMAELYFPDVAYEVVESLFTQASQRFNHERVYSEIWSYYLLQKRPQ